jgi:hypothetical protein
MQPDPDGVIEFEDGNVRVQVAGMKRLLIPPVNLDLPESFTTCRNFQFGWHYLRDPRPKLEPAGK